MSDRDDDREPILIETDERTDILELAHLECQRTLDTQIETLSDIDDKAARILRVNLVLLSVVLTGISIAADSTPSGARNVLPSLVNGYTVAGIGCLVVSTALAAVTYTSSDIRSDWAVRISGRS